MIHAEEEKRKLIFSEKEAAWSKYSNSVKIGNIYQAKVGSVEDYGAFAHLQFPDGKEFGLSCLGQSFSIDWSNFVDMLMQLEI